MAIERLAISIAAPFGISWPKASPETRQNFRIAANAALTHMGAEGRQLGESGIAHALTEVVEGARTAANVLDNHKLSEELIQRLYRVASAAETSARVLGLLAAEEEVI